MGTIYKKKLYVPFQSTSCPCFCVLFTDTSYFTHMGSTWSQQIESGKQATVWIMDFLWAGWGVSKNRACGLVRNTLQMDGGCFHRNKDKTSHISVPFDSPRGLSATMKTPLGQREVTEVRPVQVINSRGCVTPESLQVELFIWFPRAVPEW